MLQWRLGWQQKKTEKVRAKKEIRELWISRCRLSKKEQAKENEGLGKGQIWNEKGGKGGKDGGKNSWQKGSGKKGRKGQEKGGKGDSRTCCTCGKTGHIAAWCRIGGNKNMCAVDEDDGENAEESTEHEEDLQAWCLLEESENEQRQEVISQQNKRRVKKDSQASLLSMENSHNSNPKKIVEVKHKWMKVRVTMDSGAAGRVMLETMFLRVKLERKTTPKKFVAANGEQINDLGEKTIPFKTNEGVQRCIIFRSAIVVKPIISMQKAVRAGNTVVLDEKNPHIRNIRDGTVIKLDVSNGVYTMDMWICFDETVRFLAGRDSEWSSRFGQACKAGSIVWRCDDQKRKNRME